MIIQLWTSGAPNLKYTALSIYKSNTNKYLDVRSLNSHTTNTRTHAGARAHTHTHTHTHILDKSSVQHPTHVTVLKVKQQSPNTSVSSALQSLPDVNTSRHVRICLYFFPQVAYLLMTFQSVIKLSYHLSISFNTMITPFQPEQKVDLSTDTCWYVLIWKCSWPSIRFITDMPLRT